MTEPQIAIMMLVIFILSIFLGFPVAFTLMAMAVIFGYYAYFDPDRMWRSYDRAVQQAENATPEQIAAGDVAGSFELTLQYLGGFLNNRIFDLFVNQTFSVMSNDVLTAIPLFLFMGYVVERANIVTRLFDTLYVTAKGLPGAMAVAALATCALFATATGIIGAVVTL
ncbi:MAG: TRAP transporter large permease subunit, partial [Pseudomonadota bacterium]